MPASQVLIPQIRPEDLAPPSQLRMPEPVQQDPTYNPKPVQPTGYGGVGQALLSFADNFLRGASKGRHEQFLQSEQTKAEHERNFDSTVKHIVDSPNYTADFKEKVVQQQQALKASAGLAALGKGKGGKNEHPMVGLARGVFNSIVGPGENKEHVDIGPEHVSDLMSQMHAPENQFNAAAAISDTQTAINKAIETAKLQAAATNSQLPGESTKITVDRDMIMNHPDVVAALTPLRREGIEPLALPGVQAAINAIPPKITPVQQVEMEARRAAIEASHAAAAASRAREQFNLRTPTPPVVRPLTIQQLEAKPDRTPAEEKLVKDYRDHEKELRRIAPPHAGKPDFTPTQLRAQKVKEETGKLRLEFGEDAAKAIDAAKERFKDDPGLFTDVEKELKKAAPKKTAKTSFLKAYLTGQKPGATATATPTPPIVVVPAQTGAPANPYR